MSTLLYEPTTLEVDDYINQHKDSFPFLCADSPLYDGDLIRIVRHNLRIRRIARLDLIELRRPS